MSPPFIYSLKVWLTAVVISPLIGMVQLAIDKGQLNDNSFALVMGMLLYGLVFSVPSLLLLLLVTWGLSEFNFGDILVKGVLSCLSIPAVFISLRIVAPYSGLVLPIIYCAVAVACIWYYRLDRVQRAPKHVN